MNNKRSIDQAGDVSCPEHRQTQKWSQGKQIGMGMIIETVAFSVSAAARRAAAV
jgi:hypothetical protein